MKSLVDWLLMLSGFPGVALVFAVLFYYGSRLSGSRFYLGLAIAIIVGVVLTYLLCLAGIFLDPHWDDNGSRETIYFPDHFSWALLTSFFAQLFMVPAAATLYCISHWLIGLYRNSRTMRSSECS